MCQLLIQRKRFWKKLGNTARQQYKIVFNFGVASVVILGIKLLLLWLFEYYFSARVAYAISHVVVFFISYAAHCKYTFKKNFTWRSLREFAKAVVFIKLIDYLSFSLILIYYSNSLAVAATVTLVIFAIRYFSISAIFRGKL